MPQPFNLTAEINLRGPSNLKLVVGKIRRELGSIKTDLDLKIRPESAKNIALVTSKLKALSKAAVDANADIGKLNTSLSSLAANFSSLSSSTSASVNGVNGVSASVKGAAKNIAATTTEIEEFGKQSGLAVRRFAAFSTVTGVVYGLVNAFSSAFSEFINFNKEIVRLSQVTGKSTDELSGIAKEITRLSTSLGVASSDLLTVSTTLAQAGLSANDTRVALEALAKSALAPSFDDLNETTEGSIAVLRQFGLQANELEGALGSINSVAAAFAVESADLITAIQRTGGVFASSSRGVSSGTEALNEFLAIFTSVRQTTRESAETIATGLRTIFTRIQRGQTIEFLKEYNIQLTDLEGKFVGPFEAVRRLSEGLKELDPRDVRFSQIVEELGGFRQIGKVIPLIQQFAVAQDALKVAQKGQGSLAEDARVAQQSLAIQFAKTREEFLSLVRELGDSTTFKSLATITLGLANGLISLTKALEPLLPLLVTFTAIKIGSGLTQYLSGFTKGFGGGGKGGAGTQPVIPTGPIPPGAPTAAGGASATNQVNAITANTAALGSVVQPLTLLLQGINALNAAITQNNALLASRSQSPRKFATGGFVPGSGNSDTVPAMLTPGEFVIRKSAVNAIGANRLSQINRYARGGMVSGSRRKRAYVFDFDDTLAESGAVVREDQPDPFIDFRGQKGASFIRSARATRYASMAKKRAAEGYDIHVLTARPGEKQTVSAIQEFMSRNIGSSARSVIGTGGFSGAMGGTASAKSMMLKKLSSLYEQIVFLDDDKENVLAAQQISGVKARLARKNSGGLIQKFAIGGMVKDLLDGTWDKRVGAAILQTGAGGSGRTPGPAGGAGKKERENGPIVIRNLLNEASKKAKIDFFNQSSNLTLTRKSNGQKLLTEDVINVSPLYQGLSPKSNEDFQSALDTIIVKSVNAASSVVTKRLGLPNAKIPQSSAEAFLNGINKGTRGSLFEEVLFAIGNNNTVFNKRSGADDPFDFPVFDKGLFGGEFNELPNKWVDAKASFETARRDGGLTAKTFNQLRDDIVAGISSGDLSIQATAAGRKAKKESSAQPSEVSRQVLPIDLANRYKTSGLKDKDIIDSLSSGPNPYITKKPGNNRAYIIQRDLPEEIVRRNTGGSIPGVSAQDTVPALLTPGEFVINKDSAQRIGYGNLRRMNNVRGYNKGGIVGGVQTFQEGGPVNAVNTLAVISIFTSVLQPQIEKLADSFGKLDKETVSLVSGLSGAIREASSAISSTAIGLGALGASPAFRNQVIASTGAAGVAGGAFSGIGNRGIEIALNENSKQLGKFDKILQEMQQATDPELRQRSAEELDKQFNQLSQTISKNEPLISFYETLSNAGNSLLGWNSTIIAITTSSAALIGAIQGETAARVASAASSGAAAAGQLTKGAAEAILFGSGAGSAAQGIGAAVSGISKFGGIVLKAIPIVGTAIAVFQTAAAVISIFSSTSKKTAEQTAELGKRLLEVTKASDQFSKSNQRFVSVLLPAYETLRKRLSEQDLDKALGGAITKKPLQAQIDAGAVSKFGDGFINEINPLFIKLVKSNLENVNIQLGNNQSIGELLDTLKGIRLESATRQIKEAARIFQKEQFILAGGTTGKKTQNDAQDEYNKLLDEGGKSLEVIDNVVNKIARSQNEPIIQAGRAALASAKLTQSLITLETTISNISSRLSAISTQFDTGIQKIDDELNLLSAEPSVTPTRLFKENAAVLQNIQGNSQERVDKAVSEAFKLLTPEDLGTTQRDFSAITKQIRSQVLALRTVQNDVPILLKEIEQGGRGEAASGEIIKKFDELFKNIKDLDEETKSQFIENIQNALSDTGGAGNKTLDLNKLISDIPGLNKYFDLAKLSAELLANTFDKTNSAAEALASKSTEYARSLVNLNKLSIQQTKLRTETDINIRRILGEEIKSAELNKLFDDEISQMTGGIIDPQAIGQQLIRLFEEARTIRQNREGRPETEVQSALAKNAATTIKFRGALELAANSGIKLKNAFDDLENKQKALLNGQQDLARRLIENPLEIFKIQDSLNSLGRVLAGEGLPSDFPKAFEITDILKTLGPQGAANAQDLFTRILEARGFKLQKLDSTNVQKEAENQAKAIEVSKLIEEERQRILGGANEQYEKYTGDLKSLFSDEISARQVFVDGLIAQEKTLSQINQNVRKEQDFPAKVREQLFKARELSQNATKRTGGFEIGGLKLPSDVGPLELPSKGDINNIKSTDDALLVLKRAIAELKLATGDRGTLFPTLGNFGLGRSSLAAPGGLIEALENLAAGATTGGVPFFKTGTPTTPTPRIPVQPGTTKRPQDIAPPATPSPLDSSFLGRTLNSFAGSFARSLTDGLTTPVDNIIRGLNTVFSDFSTPIAAFTRSTNDLLAGLEAFNRTIADLESRGGIKGPNIPQEVSVTVTFDDTVTVVADRNGNKDLLSQIGILVSDTVRRQLNQQNTFGDRRITTGGPDTV